jgi:hypothetical protein
MNSGEHLIAEPVLLSKHLFAFATTNSFRFKISSSSKVTQIKCMFYFSIHVKLENMKMFHSIFISTFIAFNVNI